MCKSMMKVFHDHVVYDRRMNVLTKIILETMREDCGEALDVGCGDGMIASTLMSKKGGVSITGIDVLAREKTHIPVLEYDGVHIPMPDNSIDTVMLIDVLHHTDNPEELFRECCRVARKNIIIKDHILHGWYSYLKLKLMDYAGNAHYGVRLPYNYISRQRWENMFHDNNAFADIYRTRLGLYKGIFHVFFDSNLHFLARLVIGGVQ